MDIINTYLQYLTHTKRYSVHTTNAYRNDLFQFNQFLYQKEGDANIINATHQNIREWILNLVENKITSRSVNRKITTLKSFYKFLLQKQLIEVNPTVKVESLKIEKKLPTFVKQEQINFLFDDFNFGSGYENIRNKIILELLYNTGIRLSELISLKESSINFSNKSIKVTGKRNKQRIIPLSDQFLKKIEEYIKLKENIFSGEVLFVTEKGEVIYPKLVYRLVNKYLSFVSTQKKKSPHVLRHTFATHMLNNGADLNAIKEILGHANLSATEVYTHVSFEKLKSIYKHAHPRALIMED